jgi:hypothetical protein
MKAIREYNESSGNIQLLEISLKFLVVSTLQAIIEHLGAETAPYITPIVEESVNPIIKCYFLIEKVSIIIEKCKMHSIMQNESNCLEGLLDLLLCILKVTRYWNNL